MSLFCSWNGCDDGNMVAENIMFEKNLQIGKRVLYLHRYYPPAQVVELVDTLVSGTSASDSVQVRVLFWALNWRTEFSALLFFLPYCN